MQRILRALAILSLFAFSHQISAQANLEVVIFEDINGDGNDEGVGIGGLAGDLTLYEDADGDGEPDGDPIATTVTGADGEYIFEMLPPGNYVVGIPTVPTDLTSDNNFAHTSVCCAFSAGGISRNRKRPIK